MSNENLNSFLSIVTFVETRKKIWYAEFIKGVLISRKEIFIMLKLDQVSKIYSAHGVISTGFNKVNLEFHKGEFIAITGESGSGKSTLLNVISGLDSYEEGEMYIMGKPTSGYSKEDMETYRKEYIGNIFQSFNLINSYTVYQNVELVLLMSGWKKADVKERVKEIIAKVGLSDYEKTKASKLSGGQKQRVAIARALAKETPIIVADEPTGNLDVESAEGIIKLLHDISEEKLVIIVTHNYEQVEPYVTRKIQMHDGRVVEDKQIAANRIKNGESEDAVKAKADVLSTGNMLGLGLRNTFNIPAKFILLLIVFLFLCSGAIASLTTTKDLQKNIANDGWSMYFNDLSPERYIVTKKDKSPITDEDYNKLENTGFADKIERQDMFTDSYINMLDGLAPEEEAYNLYFQIQIKNIKNLDLELIEGSMPENPDEAVLVIEDEDSYIKDCVNSIMATEMKLENGRTGQNLSEKNVKVTGIAVTKEKIAKPGMWIEGRLYVSDSTFEMAKNKMLEGYCSQELAFAGKLLPTSQSAGPYYIRTSEYVEKGHVYIPEDIANLTEGYVIGKDFSINNKSIYFEDTLNLKVSAVYTDKNYPYYFDEKNFDNISGGVYINAEDYKALFSKGNYQSSVYIRDVRDKELAEKAFEDAGFTALNVNDAKMTSQGLTVVSKILYTLSMAGTLLVLFFVCYFIIKLILKSRNTYFSIIRMLGATRRNCANLLRTELFVVYNVAYVLCFGFAAAIKQGYITNEYLLKLIEILQPADFAILYVVLGIMAILLAGRYSRKMFKVTAMDVYREEV